MCVCDMHFLFGFYRSCFLGLSPLSHCHISCPPSLHPKENPCGKPQTTTRNLWGFGPLAWGSSPGVLNTPQIVPSSNQRWQGKSIIWSMVFPWTVANLEWISPCGGEFSFGTSGVFWRHSTTGGAVGPKSNSLWRRGVLDRQRQRLVPSLTRWVEKHRGRATGKG